MNVDHVDDQVDRDALEFADEPETSIVDEQLNGVVERDCLYQAIHILFVGEIRGDVSHSRAAAA